MNTVETGHTLEFLLAFDGRLRWYEGGYRVKFEIRRVKVTEERPHGLRYAFTLHAPDGKRIMGFDNAHAVRGSGSGFRRKSVTNDHWHRSGENAARPYEFKDAETLIDDFFDEVERELDERGIPTDVVSADEHRSEAKHEVRENPEP